MSSSRPFQSGPRTILSPATFDLDDPFEVLAGRHWSATKTASRSSPEREKQSGENDAIDFFARFQRLCVRGDDPMKIMQRAGHQLFSTTQGYIRTAEAVGQAIGDVFPELPADLFKAPAEDKGRSSAKPGGQLSEPIVTRKPSSRNYSGGAGNRIAKAAVQNPKRDADLAFKAATSRANPIPPRSTGFPPVPSRSAESRQPDGNG
jgi:hypothetical protein